MTVEQEILIDFRADMRSLKASMDQANAAVTKASKGMSTTLGNLKVSTIAAFGAIGLAASKMKKIVVDSFSYNKMMEDSEASLRAIVSASRGWTDVQGNAVDATTRMNAVNAEMAGILEEIKAIMPETAMGISDLISSYALMRPAMEQANIAGKDQIEILKLVSNAATNFGLSANELRSGIDDLARGTWLANTGFGKMLSSLGVTKEELKAAGDKAAYLKGKLQEAGQMADTMEVATSNLKEAWGEFIGKITEPVWEPLKAAIKVVTEQLGVHGPQASKAFAEAFREFANFAIKAVGAVAKAVGKLINLLRLAWNGFAQLGNTVSKAFNSFMGNRASDWMRVFGADSESLAKMNEAAKGFRQIAKAREDMGKTLAAEADGLINSILGNDQFAASVDAVTGAFTEYRQEAQAVSDANVQLVNTSAQVADAATKGAKAKKKGAGAAKKMKEELDALAKAQKEAVEEMKRFNEGLADTLASGIGDALLSITDKTKSFGDVMKNVLQSIARQIMQMMVIAPIKKFFSGIFGGGFGGFKLFATGGIINAPTMVAPGAIAGEAGPEAIMPIKRINGVMGVAAEKPQVNVNIVNNTGADVSVEDDGEKIDIIIGQIANQVQRGMGPIGEAFEARYGLQKR